MDESALSLSIQTICRKLGWKTGIKHMDNHTLVICPLPIDTQFSGIFFVVSGRLSRLVMYVAYREKVPENQRQSMVEVMAHINSGLLGGCIEMEPKNGEVRYRDGLLLVTSRTSVKLLQTLIATTIQEAQIYHPVIETIITGSSSQKAISKLEKK